MPIRWDTLLTRHTARELGRSLVGERLRAVRLDRAERDLTLLFDRVSVVWRLHPTRGHLRLHPPLEPLDGDLRFRCPLLEVEAPPDERLVVFRFSPARQGPVTVVVELMTNQWNALVTVGRAGTVRHALRPAGDDARRAVGHGYRPPPPTGRAGVEGDVTLETWLEALERTPEPERPRSLVRSFAWTSPINAPTLLGAGGDAGGETDLRVGFERWRAMADPATEARPVLLELPSGGQPYPFALEGVPSREVPSLLDAFEECARSEGEAGGSSPAAVLGTDLLHGLEARTRRARRRVSSLERELSESGDAEALRLVGDLLLARYQEVVPGATEVTLTGFDGEPVEVELDPTEPVHANAARYYERAAKVERAAERLPAMIEQAGADLARLEALLRRVRDGTADWREVAEVVGPLAPTRGGQVQGPALPYRTFRSSGGLEIRVGRGARFNDDLTFRHSSPGDVWLHARHASGAHVVLRWQGPERPPARDLEEAATLAALHSKARTSGSVPVDWTLRKYVRKPRKAPPGRVAVDRVETLFVEPDEALLLRLATDD